MSEKDWLTCSGCNRDLDVSFPWGAGADSIISCPRCGWCSEDDEPRTRIKKMSLDEVADHVENLNALRKEIFDILYPPRSTVSPFAFIAPDRSKLEHLLSRLDGITGDCREEDI